MKDPATMTTEELDQAMRDGMRELARQKASRLAFALCLGLAAALGALIYLVMMAKDAACAAVASAP